MFIYAASWDSRQRIWDGLNGVHPSPHSWVEGPQNVSVFGDRVGADVIS